MLAATVRPLRSSAARSTRRATSWNALGDARDCGSIFQPCRRHRAPRPGAAPDEWANDALSALALYFHMHGQLAPVPRPKLFKPCAPVPAQRRRAPTQPPSPNHPGADRQSSERAIWRPPNCQPLCSLRCPVLSRHLTALLLEAAEAATPEGKAPLTVLLGSPAFFPSTFRPCVGNRSSMIADAYSLFAMAWMTSFWRSVYELLFCRKTETQQEDVEERT